ncbi:Yip1 domain family protein [Fomitiporia mediterranea MF3/22]|uniref:Yip1 domain family protein n=1 Tax=Fomitiporia mediterranea (strain MF3/22) TaxID=694068 RepID=UPI0004407286|nr:Yip1 domain family protein [Fomitiporia mediterranea MF3/22]EJD01879.1 Yip1 domain family protein [Fomitiporia mediterranea MF3/22]
MASGYVPVEADDITEQGDALEFKSFLPEDANASSGGARGTSNVNRGYLNDDTQQRSGFWTFEYYQRYFDVDTKTVLQRCVATLNPIAAPSYVANHLSPAPDLYGPFWTLTTVIFALFVFSSLAASISSYLSDPSAQYNYNFQLLSIAVSLVYAYGLGFPALLWGALRYMGVTEWSLVEALSVWGYGQFVWIPVAALCLAPYPIVRWVLVGVACGLSGYFLLANVYPVLATANSKTPRAFVIVIVILHLALALTFKVLFFSYYVVKEIGPKDPLPGDGSGDGAGGRQFLL